MLFVCFQIHGADMLIFATVLWHARLKMTPLLVHCSCELFLHIKHIEKTIKKHLKKEHAEVTVSYCFICVIL